MGTTSEKLTYLNVTKQKLKQAINNIGGEVTDETTFRNYVKELENAYDRLPKTEFEEGESVTLENTLKGKLDFQDGKVGIGQSSQISTNGYQLLGLPDYEAVKGGVTIKIKNGLVTMSGTLTSQQNVDIPIPDIVLNTTDTFSCALNDSGTSPTGMGRYLIDSNSALIQWNYGQSGLQDRTGFSPNANNTAKYFRIAMNITGTSYNNYSFQPMFEKGNTSHTWEEYSGGYASPSPNWEQEIKYVRGWNLADYSQTYTSSSLSNYGAFNLALDNSIPIKTNKTYYFSADIRLKSGSGTTKMNVIRSTITTGQATSAITNPNMTTSFQRYVFSNTYTTEQTLSQIAFQILTDSSVVIEVKNIMIAEENIPYLPFNTITEAVRGKNLFDENDLVIGTINPTTGQSEPNNTEFRTNYYIEVNGGESYTLSNQNYTDYTHRGIFEYDSNKNYIKRTNDTTVSSTTPFTLQLSSNTKYVRIRYTIGTAITTIPTNMKIQYEQGSTLTTYEPYKTPKTYQFSLGDYKFYGIGNFKDTIRRSSGKNLFDEDVEQGSVNGYEGRTYENCKYNSNTRLRTKNLISLDKNKTYTISCDSNYRIMIQAFNDSQLLYTTTGSNAWASSITFTNIPYISITIKKVSEADITPQEVSNARIMLEIGSTATDFEPFGVGVWYKYGEVGEYKCTGNENISLNQNKAHVMQFVVSNVLKAYGSSSSLSKCNNLYYKYGNPDDSTDENYFWIYNNVSFVIVMQKTIVEDVASLKTYLSTHKTEVVYPLENPKIDIITGTLAEQLEEWWNGQSLDGTTIIEGNGDLPMIIKCRGLKGE